MCFEQPWFANRATWAFQLNTCWGIDWLACCSQQQSSCFWIQDINIYTAVKAPCQCCHSDVPSKLLKVSDIYAAAAMNIWQNKCRPYQMLIMLNAEMDPRYLETNQARQSSNAFKCPMSTKLELNGDYTKHCNQVVAWNLVQFWSSKHPLRKDTMQELSSLFLAN